MALIEYFFDSYALIEIAKGGENYRKYVSGATIITTRLQLMETYYILLHSFGKVTAEKYYNIFLRYVVDVEDDSIKTAMEFRLYQKKKRFSYVDCIGYTIAVQRKALFLTGDHAFESFPYVEYVK